tara:strand:- start:2206 stop:2382 length:177 start_codon:yes stop_codon:yes gene_type:complete
LFSSNLAPNSYGSQVAEVGAQTCRMNHLLLDNQKYSFSAIPVICDEPLLPNVFPLYFF